MSYGSPQLTREEEEVLVGGPVLDTLLTQLRGPRYGYVALWHRRNKKMQER